MTRFDSQARELEVLRLAAVLHLSPDSIARGIEGDSSCTCEEIESVRDLGRPPQRLGDFEVLGELGRGGMGVIWKGRDPDLDRLVALKVPRRRPAGATRKQGGREARRRFLFEARITSSLQHPGVVRVYQLGHAEDGSPFLALEYLEGCTLRRFFRQHEHRRFQRRFQRRFLAAFGRVCQTLAHAHDHGVVHCDIKPTNIMLLPDGGVRIIDWGLARLIDESATQADAFPIPLHAPVEGTPAYMAPEQATGRSDAIDARTDVFALGAVLYEYLLGRPLTTLRTRDELARISRELASGPRHERRLRSLARACLSFNGADRPHDAGVVERLAG